MKFVYFCTTGASDATKASIPFHMAVNGSIEVGQEAAIILAGDGAEIVLGDNIQTMQGLGLPPMSELIEKVRAKGVPVYI